MRLRSLSACFAALCAMSGAALLTAEDALARAGYAVVPAEERQIPWSGRIPACEDASVLAKIQSRFAQKESEFWSSSLTIVAFEKVRTIAHRPWGPDFVPRRFCTGVAYVSDGKKRRVDYAVGEDLGLLGVTWGVTWCVNGLDRNLAYAPGCRAAGP